MKGRPIEWTPEKKKEAIEIILSEMMENGKSVRAILTNADREILPSNKTFYEWLFNDDELSKQYHEARKSTHKHMPNPKGAKSNGIHDYRIQNANNTNSKRFPNSSIYIIKIKDTDYYKIGVSQNHCRRIRDISSCMPFTIELLYVNNHENAYQIEHEVHQMMKDKYVKSEWFILSEKEYETVVNKLSDGR